MLSKLIKEDFRSTYKLMLIIHLFGLLTAVIGRFVLSAHLTNPLPIPLIILLSIAFYGIIILLSFGTLFLVVAHFYSNLFTDQGYLTFTLPVKRSNLLHSKMIVGTFWVFVDIVVILFMLFFTLNVGELKVEFQELLQLIMESYSGSLFPLVLFFIFLLVVSCLGNTLSIYLCACIGQLFKKNRIIWSLIAYGLLTIILQVFSVILIFANNTFLSMNVEMDYYSIASFNEYMGTTFIISAVFTSILCVLSYVACHFLITKKMNLI